MKILQVIPVFYAASGGPVSSVRAISKELSKRHEVTIYTTSAKDKEHDSRNLPFEVKSDGYQTVYFPRVFTASYLNISPTMERALIENIRDFDIIHLHSWRQFQDIIVHHYAKKCHVPYILQVHGSLPRIAAKTKFKWIYDLLFGYNILKDASKVIALSQMELKQYLRFGVPKEKIEIVPNGINLEEYANLPQRGFFREKYGLSENSKIILYLGRLHQIKGIDYLIKAYANLINGMKVDNALLVLVGPDDSYLNEIKHLINKLGLENRVLLTGPLYDKEKLEAYVDADIYASPSRYEAFGISLLEACACGKPVVTSGIGGVKDFVVDGITGYLVELGNIEMLSIRILSLLKDENKSKKMGSSGRDFVKKNFDIVKIVNRLEQLYKNAIDSNKFQKRQ